jgi:tetratricopeptide (TPR) repeat protein
MRRHFFLLAALCALAAAAPRAAHADDDTDARRRFKAAAQAYREARYKEAIDLFLEANRLEPHPELVFNVAQAYEKLGDVPNALRSLRDYLRLAPAASDRPTVEASIKNLEQRLREKGIQQVSIFSAPAGAAVTVDGRAVGATPWTGEIAPGRHIVVLKHEGYPDAAKEFVLASDRSMDIDVALGVPSASPAVRTASEAPAPAPAKDAPPPAPPAGPTIAPWTWAALGVGVAGLGASLGFELARRSAESAAQGDPTQVGYKSALDTMSGRQTAARVFLGVGAAGVAIGGTLLVLDLTRRPDGGARPGTKVGLACGATGCGLSTSGSF